MSRPPKKDQEWIQLREDQKPFLIDKSILLSTKEQGDIAKIVNSTEYQSLRSYYLKTTLMLYEKASLPDTTDARLLCSFANLLKNFVIDMDRLKIERPEEASPEPYDG